MDQDQGHVVLINHVQIFVSGKLLSLNARPATVSARRSCTGRLHFIMYRSQTKMAAGKGHDLSCTCKNVDFGTVRGGHLFYDNLTFDILWRNTEDVKMT